jgi:hypothetical protein
VTDVDAAADPLGVPETLRHLDEPSAIEPGRVFEEDEGAVRPLAKTRIQVASLSSASSPSTRCWNRACTGPL